MNFCSRLDVTLKQEHGFIGSGPSGDITGDGNSFWEEIHAEGPCRALHKKQLLRGEKRGEQTKNTGWMMHAGPFTLYTQVLPFILPGLPSLEGFNKGGAAASGMRGIEVDISSN